MIHVPTAPWAHLVFDLRTDVGRDTLAAFAQGRSDASREAGLQHFGGGGVEGGVLIIHGCIPFACRALAKACTAREQCVLTLPSEQPMVAAVSATSSSSQ